MESCLFCRIASGQIPSDQVWSDEHCVAFRDIEPQAPVHVLVIPRAHVVSVAELDDAGLAGRLQMSCRAVAKELGVDAYRLVSNVGRAAGQSVFHLHWHLLAGRSLSWPPG